MSAKVILYDLPSRARCACWSLNPWKIRLVLNFKKIDYQTEWVEYPDVAPKFSSAGVAPNADEPKYTIPTLRLPSGTILQDSSNIAPELETLSPTPSLHLTHPTTSRVTAATTAAFGALRPLIIPKIPRTLLTPVSAAWFQQTRRQRLGMSLDEYETSPAAKDAWTNVEAPVAELRALLAEEEGPFFLGQTPSYADFVFVAALQCMKRVDEGIFDRFMGLEGRFGEVYGACKGWLARDD